MLRRLCKLPFCGLGRIVSLAVVVAGAWGSRWCLPERPLREWRIEGPFGAERCQIDVAAQEALIHTSTRHTPDRIWVAFGCCHISPNDDSDNVQAGYRVNLDSGRFEHVYRIDFRKREFVGEVNEAFRGGYNDSSPGRWPMAWDRDGESWTLRDAETQAVIASNRCERATIVEHPKWTHDRRWMTIAEERPDVIGDYLRRQVREWLGQTWYAAPNIHLCVFDPSTGAMVNEVPALTAHRWTPDGEGFWTVDTTYSLDGKPSGARCRLWSARAAAPSVWLLLLTAGCAFQIARDVRRFARPRSPMEATVPCD